MDIEQLRLILDLVRDAGEGAYVIALLWVLRDYFTFTVFMAVFCGSLRGGYLLLRNHSDAEKFVQDIAAICRADYLYGSRREPILDCLRKHYNKD